MDEQKRLSNNSERKSEKNENNSKLTRYIIIGVLILGVIFVLSDGNGFAEKKAPPTSTNQVQNIDMSNLADDDVMKGDPNAPVTIIEFSDYECPYCARFFSDTYKKIEENYIDTGKVNLVFRDFPLSFHKEAQKAAEAAECAGEQDRYYDMHDKLFGSGVVGGVDTFKRYALELGLDTASFNECLDSGSMANEVKSDIVSGTALGIRGTPAFIINGQGLSGAQPYDVFEKIIESELAK